MNLLLVTFSLRNAERDYASFFVTLRGSAIQWWHFIEQTCIVSTHQDVNALAKLLYPHIEVSDSLLVVRLTPHEFQGWLPKSAWEWLDGVSEQISRPYLPPVVAPPFGQVP